MTTDSGGDRRDRQSKQAAVLLDLAVKAFADENDRLKILDTRSGMLLSATSFVIGLGVTVGTKPPVNFSDLGTGTFGYYATNTAYWVGLTLALGALLVADGFLMAALWARDFPRVGIKQTVTDGMLDKHLCDLRMSLAEAYADMTVMAIRSNDSKAWRQIVAMKFLVGGLAVMAVCLLAPVMWVNFAVPPPPAPGR